MTRKNRISDFKAAVKGALFDFSHPFSTPTIQIDPSAEFGSQPGGAVYSLPEVGNRIAITLDDGSNSEVLRQYLRFAKQTGIRLTFFVTGHFSSWIDNARRLQPLVDSGQIQLEHHSWSHPDFTTLSDAEVVDQLDRNASFLWNTFGVKDRKYFRPPYGAKNHRVESIVTEEGFRTLLMWDKEISDWDLSHSVDAIKRDADLALLPGRLVLGHLNMLNSVAALDYFGEIIHTRGLQPVTLDDLFRQQSVL